MANRKNPDSVCDAVNISQNLKVGQFYYVSGGFTKVQIVGKVDLHHPEVKILRAKENSKYHDKVGETVRISRQVLYKNYGRK